MMDNTRLVMLAAALAALAARGGEDDGWEELFNGRDLSGWRVVGGEAKFSVEDGCIVGTGVPSNIGINTFVATEREFSDFDLKVEFPLDIKLLTKVLHNIAKSKADCKAEVNFTLSDSGAIQTALLDSAAKNARKKAETLCAALGAKLGELVKIDYNWSEIDIYSHTRYGSGIICGAPAPGCVAPEIDPEDIKLNDNATFVWEIA